MSSCESLSSFLPSRTLTHPQPPHLRTHLIISKLYDPFRPLAVPLTHRQLFPNSRIVDVRFLDKLASGIHPVGSPENITLRKSLVRSYYHSFPHFVKLGLADNSDKRPSSPSSRRKIISSDPLLQLSTQTQHFTEHPISPLNQIQTTSVHRSTFSPNHSIPPLTQIYSISNLNSALPMGSPSSR